MQATSKYLCSREIPKTLLKGSYSTNKMRGIQRIVSNFSSIWEVWESHIKRLMFRVFPSKLTSSFHQRGYGLDFNSEFFTRYFLGTVLISFSCHEFLF